MKEYRFTIVAKVRPDSNPTTYTNTVARNVNEAKNKFKQLWPEAKILSCVRNEETFDSKIKNKKPSESNQDSSLGSVLLGAAVTVGVGLLSSFLKKDNNKS